MIKSFHSSLQKRVTFILGGFALFVAVLMAVFGHYINEQLEAEIWRSTLQSEYINYLANRKKHSDKSIIVNGNLQIHIISKDKPLYNKKLNELYQLSPGIYDEIQIGEQEFCVLIKDLDSKRILLAYDITHLEQNEFELGLLVMVSMTIILIGIIYLSYVLGRFLVAPIQNMSKKVSSLDPEERGQLIGDSYKENELHVIANAIDAYLIKLDQFVDREKEFIDTASHELRTPIAIISGAVDILNKQPNTSKVSQRAIFRIKQATKNIAESVNALFILAKDETQLANSAQSLQLNNLIENIIQENVDALPEKKIKVILTLDDTNIFAPKEPTSIVLRNLIKNAIVYSDDNLINISLSNGTFEIKNQGKSLSPEHIASLFNKRVRGKDGEGNGLGLYLIKRICRILKWEIDISGLENNQFIVKVDLSRHIIKHS